MPGLFANLVLEAGFAVLVIFTLICIIVTGLRFYTARSAKRGFTTEGRLALGAFICLVLWVIVLRLGGLAYDCSGVVGVLNKSLP